MPEQYRNLELNWNGETSMLVAMPIGILVAGNAAISQVPELLSKCHEGNIEEVQCAVMAASILIEAKGKWAG